MTIYTGQVLHYSKDENAPPEYYNELVYWTGNFSTDWQDFTSIKIDSKVRLMKSTKWQNVIKL